MKAETMYFILEIALQAIDQYNVKMCGFFTIKAQTLLNFTKKTAEIGFKTTIFLKNLCPSCFICLAENISREVNSCHQWNPCLYG